MPDSEQILFTGTKYRKQNSVSVEQIQDNPTTRPFFFVYLCKKIAPYKLLQVATIAGKEALRVAIVEIARVISDMLKNNEDNDNSLNGVA